MLRLANKRDELLRRSTRSTAMHITKPEAQMGDALRSLDPKVHRDA